MVEELKELMRIRSNMEADDFGEIPTTPDDEEAWKDNAYAFLRDHGQALVEALADAERWREFRRMSVTVDQHALATFEEALPVGDITEADVDQAIDLARTKASAGGGK